MAAEYFAMLAQIESVTNARIALVQISTPILMAFGNIGEILNIIVFLQSTFRSNSCAIYFLAAAFTRLFFIDYTILINGLSLGYNIELAPTSSVWCKFRFYLATVATILPHSFIILACIDRLMMSSMSVRARQWSRPAFAYRMIAIVTLVWIIYSIHALVGSNIQTAYGYSYCFIDSGIYGLFNAFSAIILNYTLPPLLMTIFGVLTICNVRRAQRQVQLTGRVMQMHKKDRYLLRMLLFQVLVNVVFTIPPAVAQLYTAVTANQIKDPLQQTWDLLYFSLSLTIFYVPNCAGFYIYTLTASIFRKELVKIADQCVGRCIRNRHTRVVTITSSTG